MKRLINLWLVFTIFWVSARFFILIAFSDSNFCVTGQHNKVAWETIKDDLDGYCYIALKCTRCGKLIDEEKYHSGLKFELNSNYKAEKLILREYSKPKSGLNVKEFYEHCEKGLVIDIDKK